MAPSPYWGRGFFCVYAVLCIPDNVPMPAKPQIIDLSNNQSGGGLLAISDPQVAAVYAKATEGLSFQDAWYPKYRGAAAKRGIPFGGYLFLHPDQDGAAQARAFLAYAKPVPGDLEPVVDSETLTGGGYRQAAAATLAALDELAGHGYRPLLYGSTSFLRLLLASVGGSRLGRYRVWQAEYGPVLHRIPGLNSVAWQFTDRQVVAKGRLRVDGDRLLVRDLAALRIPAYARVSHPAARPRVVKTVEGVPPRLTAVKPKPAPKPVPQKPKTHPWPPPKKPRRVYYTFKKDVPRSPGTVVAFKEGRGYYAAPKPVRGGGGEPPKAA